jgi:cytoskeletal protein RodZ
MKIQKKKKASKAVLISVLIVAFVLAGGAGYWYLDTNGFFGRAGKKTQDNNKSNNDATSESADKTSDESDDNKNGNSQKPPVETDDSGKKVAQIVIVDASQYDDTFEVRAGVNNLTEEGGRCEFVFTQNSQVLTRSSDAIFTGTDVNCQTIEIPVKDFPNKGEWQMVVNYTSSASKGSSQSKTVVIK